MNRDGGGGQKTGILWVGALWEEGRKVVVSLWTTKSESEERCGEGWRGLVKRGMRTPATMTTEGAAGLAKALAAMWPQSFRIRWGGHKMRNLAPKVPTRAWPAGTALLVDRRDAPTREKAETRRAAMIEQDQREFPEMCRGFLADADASLHQLAVPQRHPP